MAATVLDSARAIEVSVYVVRAFVHLREMIATNSELAKKLDELERRLDTHDQSIAAILQAIRHLMTPPERKTRPIGFVVPDEKKLYSRRPAQAHYLSLKEQEGWPPERLAPLLAELLELTPWLKQWHSEYDAQHGARMGEYFDGFVADEARALGLTADDLRGWRPATAPARRERRRTA